MLIRYPDTGISKTSQIMAYGGCSAQATCCSVEEMIKGTDDILETHELVPKNKHIGKQASHVQYIRNLLNAPQQLGLVMSQKSVPCFHP